MTTTFLDRRHHEPYYSFSSDYVFEQVYDELRTWMDTDIGLRPDLREDKLTAIIIQCRMSRMEQYTERNPLIIVIACKQIPDVVLRRFAQRRRYPGIDCNAEHLKKVDDRACRELWENVQEFYTLRPKDSSYIDDLISMVQLMDIGDYKPITRYIHRRMIGNCLDIDQNRNMVRGYLDGEYEIEDGHGDTTMADPDHDITTPDFHPVQQRSTASNPIGHTYATMVAITQQSHDQSAEPFTRNQQIPRVERTQRAGGNPSERIPYRG